MKIKKKWFLTVTLGILCAITFGAGLFIGNTPSAVNAAAENVVTAKTLDEVSFTMQNGAAIRKSEPTGLRFRSLLSTADYNGLQNQYASLRFGMLIAPTDYITEKGALNYENVFGTNAVYTDDATDKTKTQIIHVYNSQMSDYNGQKAFVGVMTNVQSKNYSRNFTGVGYIRATDADGNVTYKFAADNNNSRSVSYVAIKALQAGENDTTSTLASFKTQAENLLSEKLSSAASWESVTAVSADAYGNVQISVNGWQSYLKNDFIQTAIDSGFRYMNFDISGSASDVFIDICQADNTWISRANYGTGARASLDLYTYAENALAFGDVNVASATVYLKNITFTYDTVSEEQVSDWTIEKTGMTVTKIGNADSYIVDNTNGAAWAGVTVAQDVWSKYAGVAGAWAKVTWLAGTENENGTTLGGTWRPVNEDFYLDMSTQSTTPPRWELGAQGYKIQLDFIQGVAQNWEQSGGLEITKLPDGDRFIIKNKGGNWEKFAVPETIWGNYAGVDGAMCKVTWLSSSTKAGGVSITGTWTNADVDLYFSMANKTAASRLAMEGGTATSGVGYNGHVFLLEYLHTGWTALDGTTKTALTILDEGNGSFVLDNSNGVAWTDITVAQDIWAQYAGQSGATLTLTWLAHDNEGNGTSFTGAWTAAGVDQTLDISNENPLSPKTFQLGYNGMKVRLTFTKNASGESEELTEVTDWNLTAGKGLSVAKVGDGDVYRITATEAWASFSVSETLWNRYANKAGAKIEVKWITTPPSANGFRIGGWNSATDCVDFVKNMTDATNEMEIGRGGTVQISFVAPQYRVNVPVSDRYRVVGTAIANAGEDVRLKIMPVNEDDILTVRVGETTYTPDENGWYTFADMCNNLSVTVTATSIGDQLFDASSWSNVQDFVATENSISFQLTDWNAQLSKDWIAAAYEKGYTAIKFVLNTDQTDVSYRYTGFSETAVASGTTIRISLAKLAAGNSDLLLNGRYSAAAKLSLTDIVLEKGDWTTNQSYTYIAEESEGVFVVDTTQSQGNWIDVTPSAADWAQYANGNYTLRVTWLACQTVNENGIKINGTWYAANATVEIAMSTLGETPATMQIGYVGGVVKIEFVEPQYTVNVPASRGGYVVYGNNTATIGESVSLHIVPTLGYTIKVKQNGEIVVGNNDVYTFTSDTAGVLNVEVELVDDLYAQFYSAASWSGVSDVQSGTDFIRFTIDSWNGTLSADWVSKAKAAGYVSLSFYAEERMGNSYGLQSWNASGDCIVNSEVTKGTRGTCSLTAATSQIVINGWNVQSGRYYIYDLQLYRATDIEYKYAIVVPEITANGSVEESAATALQKELARSGLWYEIISAEEAATAVGVESFICLGDALNTAEKSYDFDGYSIWTTGNKTHIDGNNSRAILYGTYGLLSKFGFTAYTDDCIAHAANVTVSGIQGVTVENEAPDFAVRSYLSHDTLWENLMTNPNQTFALANGQNGGKVNLLDVHGGSWNFYGPYQQPAKKAAGGMHNTHNMNYYLGLAEDASICLTSTDNYNMVLSVMKTLIMDNPDGIRIMFAQPDNANWMCTCNSCKSAKNSYNISGGVIRFCNNLINSLKSDAEIVAANKTNFKIVTFAYGSDDNTAIAPKGGVTVDPQLCIFYANLSNDMRVSIFNTSHNCYSTLQSWLTLTDGADNGELMLWLYDTSFNNNLAYFPSLGSIDETIAGAKEHNVTQIFVESSHHSTIWQTDMRNYIWSQKMWGTSKTTEQLKTAFLQAYFGSAATAVGNYISTYETTYAGKNLKIRWGENFYGAKVSLSSDNYITASEHIAPCKIILNAITAMESSNEANKTTYLKRLNSVLATSYSSLYASFSSYQSSIKSEGIASSKTDLGTKLRAALTAAGIGKMDGADNADAYIANLGNIW